MCALSESILQCRIFYHLAKQGT